MKKIQTNPIKTVLTITIGFLVVYLATKWKWALTTSLIIGLAGLFSTYLSEKIDFLWMKLTWLLSQIIPNILLGAIFYLFLFPISLLSKLFGKKDPLMLKNSTPSTWVGNKKEFDKASFEKPW